MVEKIGLMERINDLIWGNELRQVSGIRRLILQVVRICYVLVRDLMHGELNLRAMSLVYTTLLSVVPFLALSFSVLKGFGVHNQLEPLLYNFFQPLGPKGQEVARQIMAFVANVKVGVLGALGLVFLIYTVLSLLHKIEAAFNYVWRVERMRSLGQRFSSYLSVVLIGPVMVFSAIGVTATVMNNAWMQKLLAIEPFGTLILLGSKLVPYLLVGAAFTFIYMFIPNTRVKLGAAAVGGLVAGFLWQTTGWAFAVFIASSTKYAAIYSSFAILVLLLIWLYVNWLVLLLGSQIAFYIQYPQYLGRHRVQLRLSNRMRERLGLAVMYLVGCNHYHNRPPWTEEALAQRLDLPVEAVGRIFDLLSRQGLVVEVAGEPIAYVPAREIETILLTDLLDAIRRAEEGRIVTEARLPGCDPVDELMVRMEHSVAQELGGETLRDLVLAGESCSGEVVTRVTG